MYRQRAAPAAADALDGREPEPGVQAKGAPRERERDDYNDAMERRMFWLIAMTLSLVADLVLPSFWWGLAATIPIFALSWWIVYRSGWLG